MRLSVIMAVHNRRELTLRCVESATAAATSAGADMSFTVFDDGSTDGTYEALTALNVPIRIIRGNGAAFWARGMADAEAVVLSEADGQHDEYIVWLNDDVELDKSAFSTMADTLAANPGAVVVGAVRDPESAETTYSGMRRAGLHPLRFDLVPPAQAPQSIEVFNGNLVVVPLAVARAMGGIDGSFSHALADIDYGLRCQRAAIPVVLAPGSYGTCRRNAPFVPREIRQDWALFVGPKGGGNFVSLQRILRKSHGPIWPLVVAVTYGTWWIRRISAALRRG